MSTYLFSGRHSHLIHVNILNGTIPIQVFSGVNRQDLPNSWGYITLKSY